MSFSWCTTKCTTRKGSYNQPHDCGDERALKRLRIRALEEDTSVNAVLRGYLEEYSGISQERREAGRKLLELSRGSSGDLLRTQEGTRSTTARRSA